MDKSLLVFIAIGIGFLYFVTSFIGDIQEEDDKYKNQGYKQEHKYDKYQSIDSVGQEILNLAGANRATQIAAWQASGLREEFLTLFPDFNDMKNFVKDRIQGDALQEKLLKTINDVEDKYFSGTIDSEQAKQMLDLLK